MLMFYFTACFVNIIAQYIIKTQLFVTISNWYGKKMIITGALKNMTKPEVKVNIFPNFLDQGFHVN